MKSNVTSEMSDQESARFIADMQRFEANVAIGNSTARGRGNKGTTKILRSYLTSLALEDFATSNQATFSEQLDQCTNEIVAMFAPDQGSWGLARK